MPIKIIKQGDDLYTAEVIASNGTWRSPHPLPSFELDSKLFRLGYNVSAIERAFLKVGVVHTSDAKYRYVAKITRPFLEAALAGEREVPEQEPIAEAWLAVALNYYDRMLPLWDVIESADAIEHDIPNYDEISWAFLRLRKRGWLTIEGEMYGLTPEARRAVKEIVDRGEPHWPVWGSEEWSSYVKNGRLDLPKRTRRIKKLENWIAENPPPGDE